MMRSFRTRTDEEKLIIQQALKARTEGKFTEALTFWDKVPHLSSYNWIDIAHCWIGLGNFKKALDTLIALSPRDKRNNRYYPTLALIHSKMGNPDLALKVLQEAPDDPDVRNDYYYYRLTEFLRKNNHHDELEKAVQQFFKRFPKSPFQVKILENYIRLLTADQQYANALELAQYLHDNFFGHENHETYIISYANLLRLNGRYEQAEQLITPIILKPRPSEYALMCLARIYIDSNNHEQAQKTLQRMMKFFPTNCIAKLTYCANYEIDLQGRQKILLPILDSKVTSSHHKAEAAMQLAVAYRNQNQLEDAQIYACKAIKLDEKYAPAYSVLGHIYADKGNQKAAQKQYEKALEIDPERFAAKHSIPESFTHLSANLPKESSQKTSLLIKMIVKAENKSSAPSPLSALQQPIQRSAQKLELKTSIVKPVSSADHKSRRRAKSLVTATSQSPMLVSVKIASPKKPNSPSQPVNMVFPDQDSSSEDVPILKVSTAAPPAKRYQNPHQDSATKRRLGRRKAAAEARTQIQQRLAEIEEASKQPRYPSKREFFGIGAAAGVSSYFVGILCDMNPTQALLFAMICSLVGMGIKAARSQQNAPIPVNNYTLFHPRLTTMAAPNLGAIYQV